MGEIKFNARFVDYYAGTSKADKPFYVVTISDGLRSASCFMDAPLSIKSIEEGDEVEVTAELQFTKQNSISVRVTSVDPV